METIIFYVMVLCTGIVFGYLTLGACYWIKDRRTPEGGNDG